MLVKAKDLSDVVVTFTDGEVITYRITANVTINRYLAREAGQCGVLTLFNNDQSFGIPLTSVRNWTVSPVFVEGEEQPTDKVIDHE